jgi:hypothetical protein
MPTSSLTSVLPLFMWNDVIVVVDNGRATPAEYLKLGDDVLARAARYPRGIAGVVIVPPHAPPPSEKTRTAIKSVLERLGTALRSVCWCVEGGGFQGAMVRGVVIGLRLLARLPYATHVTTDLTEAIAWSVRQLDGADRRVPQAEEGARWVEQERRAHQLLGDRTRSTT